MSEDAPVRRGRGRPRIYATVAERLEADRERKRAARAAVRATATTPDAIARLVEGTQARLNRTNRARSTDGIVARVLAGPVGELPPTMLARARAAYEVPEEVIDDDLAGLLLPRFPNVASAFQYARDVLSGKVPACKWVRLACERHTRDLDRSAARAWVYVFDAERAERAMVAMQMFREVKGPRAGQRLRFMPWQRFIVGSIFGWIDETTGWRRFRYALAYVPRGNGKTTVAAPLGLYMLALDREGGSECYAAAVTRGQARIVFDLAKVMALKDNEFRQRHGIACSAQAIVQMSSASTFKPLSRDAQSLDGLNVHLAILDELAQHKTAEVHDVLLTATGKRGQPLMFCITTAGSNTAGVGFRQWRYCQQVLLGEAVDEEFFGVIYAADAEDDWNDPATWRKANPNWGVSVMPRAIANSHLRALTITSEQNVFKMKHLNVWTNADVSWMNMEVWNGCGDPALKIEDFEGEEVILGVDLATRTDLAAKSKLFRREVEGVLHYYVFTDCYIPEAALGDRRNTSYPEWNSQGWLSVSAGEVNDIPAVEASIIADAAEYRIIDVAYDSWQSAGMASNLERAEVPVIEMRQTVQNFSPAMKEIEALVKQGRLHHDANPVLAWCVSCTRVFVDQKENIYPRKDRNDPLQKIDALVALIMAMSRQMALDAADSGEPALYVFGGAPEPARTTH